MKRIILTLMGLTAGAAPLAAQHAQHFAPPPPNVRPPASIPAPPPPCAPATRGADTMDAMLMMDSMMAPMRWMEAFRPGRLLESARDLELTPVQEAALGQLEQGSRSGHDSAHAAAREHMRQLSATLDAPTPDIAAAVAHFDGMLEATGQAHSVELRIALRARALLSDAQRSRVDAWRLGLHNGGDGNR